VYMSFYDPVNAMNSLVYPDSWSPFSPASLSAVAMVNAIHVYHVVMFKLNSTDRFHHLLFIPLVGFPGQYYDWGALRSLLTFCISGFPGGIDYVNLVLFKVGKMSKERQKYYCMNLNTWIRGPLIVMCVFMQYMSILYGKNTVPLPANLLVGSLALFNGLFYLQSSTKSYQRNCKS
jgi:hypothetical protein